MSIYKSGRTTALNEYFQWETRAWVDAVSDLTTDEKTVFMPVELVKTYFSDNYSSKLSSILCEVFDSDYPPVDPELILRDHTAIFCLLLRIGQGKEIEYFAQYEELSDRRLPFDSKSPPAEFPELDDDADFLQRFCDTQQMYCVPVFESTMQHKRFQGQRLLPIVSKSFHGTEGVAGNYVIKLYRPHNKLLPRGQEIELNNSVADTFVLKRYSGKENERYYRDEVNGFRSVKHADSIARFYGSYIHGKTFNTLLEFGDKGTLENYFKREAPPSRGVDIIKFWEAQFSLIKGLKAIHSIRQGHMCVRPENILVFSNGSDKPSDWRFKFANFGVILKEGQRMSQMQDSSSYGPPECYRPYSDDQAENSPTTKSSWTTDIWSLGCIYSEAAMWIADGQNGLVDYRRHRIAETDRILFKAGDSFHDGERVLQTVLDAHRDIEDRLRRSDYITKDVLESMVDEMLWEEDRPNAKALLRKSEMVLSRARQKLPPGSGEELTRTSTANRRLPARRQPPTVPLPPIPRTAQGPVHGTKIAPTNISSILEHQYPLNVEKWRSQVSKPQTSEGGSEVAGSTFSKEPTLGPGTVSDLDRDGGSISSWAPGENESLATPFTSANSSVQYHDYHRQVMNEGRRLHSQSYEFRRHPTMSSHGPSIVSESDFPDSISVVAAAREQARANTIALETGVAPPERESNNGSAMGTPRIAQEPRPVTRATSRSSSRHSSYSSPSVQKGSVFSSKKSEDDFYPKSQKRNGGFSLFPTRNRNSDRSPASSIMKSQQNNSTQQSFPSLSDGSRSTATPTPMVTDLTQPIEYLSLNTCMEWKNALKKVKKSKAPTLASLPGGTMLLGLSGRDHMFIVDDSASMASVWSDVKRVFECLSSVTKGMSPDGTELYFTVSYDTWRRKDTSDLVNYMEKKTCGSQRSVAFRLDLQLQDYRARRPKLLAGGKKAKEIRPLSIYVLTNGEWGEGRDPDPKVTLQATADVLKADGAGCEQVTVQFISFANSAEGMQRLNEIRSTDYGVDIVDVTRWNGNVLKMLSGPLNRGLFEDYHGTASPPSSTVGVTLERGVSYPATTESSPTVNELA